MNRPWQDLHAVLGVSEQAGPEELRRAYLALAVKYHPDRNPGDAEAEERFKDVSQAYAILSDPKTRARYERLRPRKQNRNQGREGRAGAKTDARGGGSASAAGGGTTGPAGGPGRASPHSAKAADSRSAEAGGTGRASRPSAGTADEGRSTTAGASGRPETGAADIDEMLAGFFKSDKGRDTLRDLEAEMAKAGLKFKAADFTDWIKSRQQPAAAGPAPQEAAPSESEKSLWARLTAILPGAGARARKKAGLYEINYQIALTPQVAARGTLVEISYSRGDSRPHCLKVRIPAGARDGSRLRLAGQGRRRPGPDPNSRGDLILTIVITQGNTVADLWSQQF